MRISEGLLSLDDRVISFFPRAVPKNPSEHWRALKVRHLLSMVTGHEEDPGERIGGRPPREWMHALFETDLPYEPGTHFVYNSTASNLVSMIVQKLTGQKIANYLRDRLFRPLDIHRPYWETDPLGHNWGGWGLYLRTDQIARFGQTLLQRGAWHGQQLIPAGWVDQATRKQVSNGDDPNSDWAQGYGFQFWMSRHGYRGDGAFGQFCVVLPEQDAVLVTTASSRSMQGILDVAWRTLLPGLRAERLPEDAAAAASVRDRLGGLEIERPEGASSSPFGGEVSGRVYALEDNPLGWRSLKAEMQGRSTVLTLGTAKGEQGVRCGMADWQDGKLALDVPMPLPVAATARWTEERTFEARVCYLNPASTRMLELRFDGDRLDLSTVFAGTFAPPEEIKVSGAFRDTLPADQFAGANHAR